MFKGPPIENLVGFFMIQFIYLIKLIHSMLVQQTYIFSCYNDSTFCPIPTIFSN